MSKEGSIPTTPTGPPKTTPPSDQPMNTPEAETHINEKEQGTTPGIGEPETGGSAPAPDGKE